MYVSGRQNVRRINRYIGSRTNVFFNKLTDTISLAIPHAYQPYNSRSLECKLPLNV